MIESLARYRLPVLVVLCLISAVAGWLFRVDSGPASIPLMYPATAVVAVVIVLGLTRLLAFILKIRSGDGHGD
jgi:hypothetical protein